MNNDGFGFTGAGLNDRRLGGSDLQHVIQKDDGGAGNGQKQGIREGGGPMKEHVEQKMDHLHRHLEEEKHRHSKALDHHKHHLEKHHGRHYDSRHGHDTHKY